MYNHQLDTFITVADTGSFNKASQELYISSNAIMKQINSLEEHLGFPLFERTKKGLKLTKAGESIYRDAKYMIHYSQDSIYRAEALIDDNQHVVRIGTSFTTPVKFLVSLWFDVQTIYPELKMELKSFENNLENAREIMNNFGKNIDFVAGIYSDNLLKSRNCQAMKLYHTPICVAVPMSHPLAKKNELEIEDLYDETVLVIQRNYMNDFDNVRADLVKNHPEVIIEDMNFFNVEAFNRCINEDKLMLAVSEWSDIHPMLKIIPVNWSYCIPFGILYSPRPSQDVEMFIDALNILFKRK